MAPPAGPGATGPLHRTSQFLAADYPGQSASRDAAVNHTLIVPAEEADQFARGSYRGRRAARPQRRYHEPWLQRWLFSRRILVVLAVIVVGVGAWWVVAGQYFKVPPVAGLSVSTARDELTSAGLVVVSGRPATATPCPRARSSRPTRPPGRSIRHGGKVTVVPSLGPILISVPPVTGQQVAAADQALKAAGLIPAAATKQASASDPVRRGDRHEPSRRHALAEEQASAGGGQRWSAAA